MNPGNWPGMYRHTWVNAVMPGKLSGHDGVDIQVPISKAVGAEPGQLRSQKLTAHHNRQITFFEHMTGHAAENQLPEPRMRIGAHRQQIRTKFLG